MSFDKIGIGDKYYLVLFLSSVTKIRSVSIFQRADNKGRPNWVLTSVTRYVWRTKVTKWNKYQDQCLISNPNFKQKMHRKNQITSLFHNFLHMLKKIKLPTDRYQPWKNKKHNFKQKWNFRLITMHFKNKFNCQGLPCWIQGSSWQLIEHHAKPYPSHQAYSH